MAWLVVVGLASVTAFGACSGADTAEQAGAGTCGNGLPEGLEECDDGNGVHNDACRNDCTAGLCGNGVIDSGEACDDGDDDNDNGCSNACKKNNLDCGNGTVDDGEECDDGNDVNDDDCTNSCTSPRCGDGIVQAGEGCDDGNNELDDNCPPDCDPGGQGGKGGSGGDPCQKAVIYAGTVSNSSNPSMAGSGIASVWDYGGFLGVQAGNAMCAKIGADHVCSYKEVVQADKNGELKNLDPNLSYWLHRVTETVPKIGDAGMTAPGPGGRCNDWTYPTNHVSDGEYMVVANPNQAGAAQVGSFWYYFDNDTKYTGKTEDGHQCAVNDGSQAGCAGGCNGATRAILCCYPTCE